MAKVGVLFANLGTPKSPSAEDVGDYLGEFLDRCLSRGDTFTCELPPDCVPLRSGVVSWDKERFSEIVAA